MATRAKKAPVDGEPPKPKRARRTTDAGRPVLPFGNTTLGQEDDENVALERLLIERWSKREHTSQIATPHAYASEALACDRQIGYRLLNIKDRPYPLSTLINFFIGIKLHDVIQEELVKLHPDFVAEQRWALEDNTVSGRADGLYTNAAGKRVVVEIKSTSLTSYNAAVRNGAPSPAHMMQAQLSAYVLGCEEVHIIYICKNLYGEANPIANWKFPLHPGIALAELERMRRVVKTALKGRVPNRLFRGEEVANPLKAKDSCEYCDFVERCILQGGGERAIDEMEGEA